MNFTLNTTLTIRNQHYTFVMNDRNTIDQDESGGRAVIYQIRNTTHNTIHALKVFKDGFRESYNSKNFAFSRLRSQISLDLNGYRNACSSTPTMTQRSWISIPTSKMPS